MKYHILLAAGLLLASCTTTKPPTQAPPSEPVGTDAIAPDSTLALVNRQLDSVVVERPRTFLDKVLHRTPKPYTVAVTPAHRAINIGKKATVSVYYGPATVTTTTVGKKATAATAEAATVVVAAKKAGPVVLADSGAQVQVATTSRGQAAAGSGIHQEQPPEPSPLAGVLRGAGQGLVWLVAAGAVVVFLTSGGPGWLLGLVRRKSNDNQA